MLICKINWILFILWNKNLPLCLSISYLSKEGGIHVKNNHKISDNKGNSRCLFQLLPHFAFYVSPLNMDEDITIYGIKNR